MNILIGPIIKKEEKINALVDCRFFGMVGFGGLNFLCNGGRVPRKIFSL
jgi:hypothetical protein